jgi:alpha-L-fucosidase
MIANTIDRRSVTAAVALAAVLQIAALAKQADAGPPYQPTWESLDSRPVPAWFADAKFGIFVHWGPYSVPAYRPFARNDEGELVMSGTYAEWYGPDVMYRPDRNDSFHARNYGEGFSYFDFGPRFRAELWDPAAWADLFRRSGAGYVVLTTKHCDGFALWPSRERHARGWNAGDTGPRRDLVGELTRAVRERGLRMGFYYAFMEYWSTPTRDWPANPKERTGYYVPREVFERHRIPAGEYVDHLHTQVRELIEGYSPDVFWPDAEWDGDEQHWKSRELLAWIYNHSTNPDLIVNDRWAQGTRGRRGGFLTTEYGHGAQDVTASRPWEECQGMGHSFGYNRAETAEHYRSSRELVATLVRTVAAGGNLLLNVGPTADGRIPVEMQERLIDVGRWLERNGEAIYGTRPLPAGSAVRVSGPATLDGKAFFTRKGDALYLHLLEWPEVPVVVSGLRAVGPPRVRLLGVEQPVSTRASGDSLVLALPSLSPNHAQAAYVAKLEGVLP